MPITFEDIRKANDSIKTIAVSGKDYAEVNQRIKAFRMVYPEGFIHTDLVKDENGVCMFCASVGYYDGGTAVMLGTGTAYEKENSTFINKTSYIENCETSAVGRALGMAGFGIDTSVASAEEVQNAIANQKAPKKKKDEPAEEVQKVAQRTTTTEELAKKLNLPDLPSDREELYKCLTDLGTDLQKVAVAYKYKTVDDMPIDRLQQALVRKIASKRSSLQEGDAN